jgi:hypothetical protein
METVAHSKSPRKAEGMWQKSALALTLRGSFKGFMAIGYIKKCSAQLMPTSSSKVQAAKGQSSRHAECGWH